jgi:ABC-type multidrug transport system ATPase subunit
MTDVPAIEVRRLSKLFGSVVALRQLELTFARGSATILAGHNGAGKSTLLSILSSLMKPTTGTVQVMGGEGALCDAALRRSIGFAPEQPLAYAELTGRENLLFYARAFGLSAPESTVGRWLEEFRLTAVADRAVGGYSQGERRRLGLARALLHEPAVLLLDEPSAGLDVEGVRHLLDLLESQRRAGVTMVVSTHDTWLASELGERVVLLHRGAVMVDRVGPSSPQEWRELLGGAV